MHPKFNCLGFSWGQGNDLALFSASGKRPKIEEDGIQQHTKIVDYSEGVKSRSQNQVSIINWQLCDDNESEVRG